MPSIPAVVDLVTQSEKPEVSHTQPEVAQESALVLMLERVAANPAVDVEKLERLIAMQERILDRNAKAAFEAQFAKMQPEIPVIDEKGRIEVRGQVRSTYAPLEDIHDVIKPILAKFGFAIRHRTEWPTDKPNILRIVGILGHQDGHSEESCFEAAADKSDFRSDIQSMGSTVSYGRRYTTLDLLNISTRKMDTDGQTKKSAAEPDTKKPEGFDAWLVLIESVADNGMREFSKAWNDSPEVNRAYLARTDPKRQAAIKTKAANTRVK